MRIILLKNYKDLPAESILKINTDMSNDDTFYFTKGYQLYSIDTKEKGNLFLIMPKKNKTIKRLKELASGYRDALENDYCGNQDLDCYGERPDEIALSIIRTIEDDL